MIHPLRAFLVMSFALTVPAIARLGDTPEQCHQRYGARYTEKGGDGFWTAERVYEVNGIRLILRFLPTTNGVSRAAYIDYKPVRGKMSDVQIQTFLETVAKTWNPLTELREEKKADSKSTAETSRFQGAKKIIPIESSISSEKRKREKAEKERADLLMDLAAKNKQINELKDRIRTTASWYEPHTGEALNCWTSPYAFAGSSPQRVVIFTSEYLRYHEKGTAPNAKDKASPLPQENTGFSGF